MDIRLPSCVIGLVLLVLSGAAQAKCEDLRVIVRNSVYTIVGLEAFCTEFNKMKADIAGMRGSLERAREENALLRARLAAATGPVPPPSLAGRETSQDAPAR